MSSVAYSFLFFLAIFIVIGVSSAFKSQKSNNDYLMAQYVHKKLRVNTEEKNILSFGGVLSRWEGREYKKLRTIVGVITVIFLGIYAAAQFKAGSKALHVLFDWDYSTGAIIGAVIVFLYCLSGGIRASQYGLMLLNHSL